MAQALSNISPESLETFSKRMPSKIEAALDFPTVGEMVKAVGEGNIKAYLEFELIKLANLVSIGGNLNNAQVVFIAQELINIFPNESLADFKLCFSRGAIGQYGEIYRLDGIVLREWMRQYLDEKYQVLENQLQKQKQSEVQIQEAAATSESIKAHIEVWKKSVESGTVKSVRPLTEEELRQEGREHSKRLIAKANGYTPEFVQLREKIHRTSSEYYASKETFSHFELFHIKGHDIFAENEEDALKIYHIANGDQQ